MASNLDGVLKTLGAVKAAQDANRPVVVLSRTEAFACTQLVESEGFKLIEDLTDKRYRNSAVLRYEKTLPGGIVVALNWNREGRIWSEGNLPPGYLQGLAGRLSKEQLAAGAKIAEAFAAM